MRQGAKRLRLAVPLAALLPLVWLMVGCVYVPWFESAQLTGTKRDIRDAAHLGHGGPRYDGTIAKDQVLDWLGPPAAKSDNDRVWVYTMDANHGVWIEPLCDDVVRPADRYVYALGLRFDVDGTLEHHTLATVPVQSGVGQINQNSPEFYADRARAAALGIIDRENGVPPEFDRSPDANAFRIRPPPDLRFAPFPPNTPR